ncbi:hypothetical protein PR048_027376 [Dryococelus australis]|uniref:Uncharacterized protein n=1 Tax=Dryococelus australis TaxID=614101 RepID=A0ABQ9GFA9_9NEOP|nr:hypothetical protein PR048_027376 [Dryococelus australis]
MKTRIVGLRIHSQYRHIGPRRDIHHTVLCIAHYWPTVNAERRNICWCPPPELHLGIVLKELTTASPQTVKVNDMATQQARIQKVKTVHDKVSTLKINFRKISLLLQTLYFNGRTEWQAPSKVGKMDGKRLLSPGWANQSYYHATRLRFAGKHLKPVALENNPITDKAFSYLAGPLRIRQHQHGSCVIDVQAVNRRRGRTNSSPTANVIGATVTERLARSPPTKANRAQSPPGSPDFRKWESCRTMMLFCGFSRGSPVSPVSSFRCHSMFASITLIGSQGLAAKSRPNLFSHRLMHVSTDWLLRAAKNPLLAGLGWRAGCSELFGERPDDTLLPSDAISLARAAMDHVISGFLTSEFVKKCVTGKYRMFTPLACRDSGSRGQFLSAHHTRCGLLSLTRRSGDPQPIKHFSVQCILEPQLSVDCLLLQFYLRPGGTGFGASFLADEIDYKHLFFHPTAVIGQQLLPRFSGSQLSCPPKYFSSEPLRGLDHLKIVTRLICLPANHERSLRKPTDQRLHKSPLRKSVSDPAGNRTKFVQGHRIQRQCVKAKGSDFPVETSCLEKFQHILALSYSDSCVSVQKTSQTDLKLSYPTIHTGAGVVFTLSAAHTQSPGTPDFRKKISRPIAFYSSLVQIYIRRSTTCFVSYESATRRTPNSDWPVQKEMVFSQRHTANKQSVPSKVMPFLTELRVIGVHNCEVFIYWRLATQDVLDKVWSNYKRTAKVVFDDNSGYEMEELHGKCTLEPASIVTSECNTTKLLVSVHNKVWSYPVSKQNVQFTPERENQEAENSYIQSWQRISSRAIAWLVSQKSFMYPRLLDASN